MVDYKCENEKEKEGDLFISRLCRSISGIKARAIFHYGFAANGIEKLPVVFSAVHKS